MSRPSTKRKYAGPEAFIAAERAKISNTTTKPVVTEPTRRPTKPRTKVPVVSEPVVEPKTARFGTKTKIGGGVLLTTAAAGTGYAAYRHHKKQKGLVMSKSLVNPFEEVVVFGKAYPVALPVSGSTRLRALVPTGAHVSHDNKLTHVRGGGPTITRQQLQRYTTKTVGHRQGPFGKSDLTTRRRIPNSKIPAGSSHGSRIA